MATTATPQDVVRDARAARTLVAGLLSPADGQGSVEEWSRALEELQSLANVVAAAQDSVIVRLAAIEPDVAEDGTLGEVRKPAGHVSLDAPAIVSGVLCLSAVAAERRVRDAVRRAADGPEGTDTCTGLGGLHAAMCEGRLDGYRAGVVAHELEECPAEVAATVIASLSGYFATEDATRLRRRVRRLLAKVSPDLLRRRAVRARAESSLRRWVDEPGVDTWLGTFPSEEACRAWAAVDALAQQYLADGTCLGIDRARAKALTDLVTAKATIDVHVVLTTPADAPAPAAPLPAGAAGDLVQVSTASVGEPALVRRDWLEAATAATRVAGRDRTRLLACDTGTGAPVDPTGELSTTAYRPTARLAAFVRARDRHCRFPGCSVAARFCDLDHVTPWPTGPTSARNLACLCRRHHRTKQRPGWHAVLHPDASMTWTDPTGRVRTSHPPDQLHSVTLSDTGTDPPPPPADNPSPVLPDRPHSPLEHCLEHRGGADSSRPPCRVEIQWPRPGRPTIEATGRHRSHRTIGGSSSGDPPF
ncbi:HNH endonuclease signature motif containing protein [Phycicoccus sonneratiae]|uniref:HNH endonuclease n=1 Tax=Phycicoccus sonneratiae TaxID=2807628 RepID=A0ABS2CIA0_9MICO|nr:HNH endonuclease signature motif containing protein [Phycicoccus sonneraticus]MBM6399602.1 HNH endonuclease [Phycicoccus sonneraticus]